MKFFSWILLLTSLLSCQHESKLIWDDKIKSLVSCVNENLEAKWGGDFCKENGLQLDSARIMIFDQNFNPIQEVKKQEINYARLIYNFKSWPNTQSILNINIEILSLESCKINFITDLPDCQINPKLCLLKQDVNTLTFKKNNQIYLKAKESFFYWQIIEKNENLYSIYEIAAHNDSIVRQESNLSINHRGLRE